MWEIGRRLRERREQANLTQGQVAAYEGCDVNYISKLERGTNQPNVWPMLGRLAKRYRTTTDYLLGLTDDPSPAVDPDVEHALTPEQQLLLEQINDEFTSLSARDQRIALDFLRMMRKAEEEGPDAPITPRIIGDE